MSTRTRIAVTIVGSLLAMVALALAIVGLATHQLYAVATGSMSPTIPPRSLVVVDPGHYQLGEPISFHHNGGVITHRFIGVNQDGTLITKGDANRTPDPFVVKPSDVIGGVVASPAHLGYWLVYLKNPWGLASLLVAFLVLYQVWALFGDDDAPRAPAAGRHTVTLMLGGGRPS